MTLWAAAMTNQNQSMPLLSDWDENIRHAAVIGLFLPTPLEALVHKHPELHLSWISPSRYQVDKVRRRWQRHRNGDRLDVHPLRGERLSGLNQRSYERVLLLNLFQLLQQRQQFLDGLKLILRPGALVQVCEQVDPKTKRLPGQLSIKRFEESFVQQGWALEPIEVNSAYYPHTRYWQFKHG